MNGKKNKQTNRQNINMNKTTKLDHHHSGNN